MVYSDWEISNEKFHTSENFYLHSTAFLPSVKTGDGSPIIDCRRSLVCTSSITKRLRYITQQRCCQLLLGDVGFSHTWEYKPYVLGNKKKLRFHIMKFIMWIFYIRMFLSCVGSRISWKSTSPCRRGFHTELNPLVLQLMLPINTLCILHPLRDLVSHTLNN